MAFPWSAVDLGGNREAINAAVKNAEASLGPIYMLVNCAGFAKAQVFEDIPHSLVKVSAVYIFGLFIQLEANKKVKVSRRK